MKKYINIKLIGLVFLLAAFASCEKAKQDVSPVISPLDKPMVTFAMDRLVAAEGETINCTITFNKPIERSVTFSANLIEGTATDGVDFLIGEEGEGAVTMPAYATEVVLPILLLSDYEIEDNETFGLNFSIDGIAEKYLVHPDVVFPSYDFEMTNTADPTLLTINFAWNTENDFDIVTFSDTPTYPAELWGTGGATGANPEIDHSIWLADPIGDYYVCILDWDEGINWDYTFTLAHPDGTIQTITGTFDGANYPYEFFVGPSSWGSPNAYKILKVVNDGTTLVVTKL